MITDSRQTETHSLAGQSGNGHASLETGEGTGDAEHIRHLVDHAIHYLPTQGPISVFVHHNTLHSLEQLPFEEAVVEGSRRFGCEPWWSEARYRAEMQSGRIRNEDLHEALLEDLGDRADVLVGAFGTRFALRMAMLEFPLQSVPDIELQWLMSESGMLQRFLPGVSARVRDGMVTGAVEWIGSLAKLAKGEGAEKLRTGDPDANRLAERALKNLNGDIRSLLGDIRAGRTEAATLRVLWAVAEEGTRLAEIESLPQPVCVRPRDRLVAEWGQDPDSLVHDVLIRFCGAYLDQGFAPARLPGRQQGFASSFAAMYARGAGPRPAWMRGCEADLRALATGEVTALDSIHSSLRGMDVPPTQWGPFIERTLLALAGWAGMIWQMETSAPWTPRPAPAGSLIEFLAVRLILDRQAAGFVGRGLGQKQRRRRAGNRRDHELLGLAWTVFQMAQVRGWSPQSLASMSADQWTALIREIGQFSSLERRRIFHRAYERRFRVRSLDALAIHAPARLAEPAQARPAWQVVTCIDDREESLRRHLEELDPACETYGAAGFFAVVMYYRGVDQAHFRPLCPINVVPRHYVLEEPLFSLRMASRARSLRRRWLGIVTRRVHVSSRTILGGALAGLAGTIATFPLLGRVLAPGWTARIRQSAGELVRPVATELRLARSVSHGDAGGDMLGFTTGEMAAIVVRLLQDIGLVRDFAPVVVLLGHGSSSLNNPHESAYNCGACSGSKGGPNARAFAWMANQPRVRTLVREQGIDLPDSVHFVGGIHDTCTDRVEFFDLDAVPPWHRDLFLRIQSSIEEACMRNAHERSRRFGSVPLEATPAEALQAVRERAEDLSQVRPEYNHATTALCLVGRREWSRSLYLDRRAFLVSYDPAVDDASRTILARILGAVIPVCGGISLEYFFSAIDPEGYGCGSKLPHNIVSLAGVMTGAASDLRPGLSQQMTEIHEPVRLLFVVECDPESLLRVVRANPVTEQLVMKQWVQLAAIEPQTGQIHLLSGGRFRPWEPECRDLPRASGSLEWYRGQRGHLEFARITGGSAAGHARDGRAS